jgi:hypothetical protein
MHKHQWICTSPGEYDTMYECEICGVGFMESADNPSKVAPEFGCQARLTTSYVLCEVQSV